MFKSSYGRHLPIELPCFRAIFYYIKLKSSIEDYIRMYCYRIAGGKINGTLEDITLLISNDFEIQIVEIGYMYSTMFIKDSIVSKISN